MAIKVTLERGGTGECPWSSEYEREQIYQGKLTLSGNYWGGATHGDTLSFANIFGLLLAEGSFEGGDLRAAACGHSAFIL